MPAIVVKPGLAPILSVPLLVNVPVPMSMVPPLMMTPPELLMNVAVLGRLKVAPWLIWIVPAFVPNPEFVDIDPALTLSVPLLVKFPEVMLKDWPAVLPIKVPEFTTVAALFWAMPP